MSEASTTGADERVIAALERVEARLERLEQRLDGASKLAEAAPGAIAMAGDTFDSAVASLARRGVDVDARLQAALALLERVSAPETLANLERLLDVAESLPGLAAAAGDTLDGIVGRLADRGVDVDERLHILACVSERLTAPEALSAVSKMLENIDSLVQVLDSGIFEECAIATVGCAAKALAEIRAEGIHPVGVVGAMRALSDPGVQRSLGVAVEFGRRFGSAMEEEARRCDGR